MLEKQLITEKQSVIAENYKKIIDNFGKDFKGNDGRRYLLRLYPNVPAMFSRDSIITKEKVGEGTFGNVFQCSVPSLGPLPLIAKFLKSSGSLDFEVERNLLHAVSPHPNFPFCFGYCADPKVILMQSFDSAKTIASIVDSKEEILQWTNLLTQIVNGILHLHDNMLVLHNDIKVDNILIKNGDRAVIIDLGKVTPIAMPKIYNLNQEQRDAYNKLHRYLAYELRNVANARQTPLTDAYSFGYLLRKINVPRFSELSQKLLLKTPSYRMNLSGALRELKQQ